MTAIVYSADQHDRTAVLQAFYDANPGFVEAKSFRYAHRLIGDHGRQWQTAHCEIADEYFKESRDAPPGTEDCEDQDCPL